MGRVISTCIQFIDAFTNPSKQTINSMRRMAQEAKKAGRDIQKTGKAIQNAGKSLTKTVTTPITGVGIAAIKTATDFENSMAKVSTIADTTKTPMSELKEQVKNLSNTVGIGITDIAEAQYQAISAGVDTASSVDFVSTAVKAAKGGFTDTTTAVDGLTTVLNAYGLKAGEAAKISDQMLMAQNYGKTTFGDMASSMGQVIPIASSLNVATEELFGSIAVLTKNGIGTSEAVTGLKAAYSNILKPSAEAGKTAKELGIDFSAAHLKSVGWAKFLDEIKEKTGGNAESMARLFGSTEALNSVTVLAGKGSKDFAEALKLMGESGGATEAAYKKILTPTERMKISLNKIKNSLIQFGTALTPAFEKAAGIIGKVGNKLNSLSENQVTTIVKFAGMAAAIGPCILMVGKVVTGVGKAVSTFGKFRSAVVKAGSVMKLLASPMGIAIGVMAAVALAAVLVAKNWDNIKPVIMKVKDWFVSTFGGTIKQAINAFKEIIKTVGPVVQKMTAALIKAAPIIAKQFVGALKKLSPVLKAVGNAVKAVTPVIGKLLSSAFSFVGKTIKSVMPSILTIAKTIGGVLLFAIRKVSPVVVKLGGIFSKIFAEVIHVVSGTVKKLQPVFNVIGTIIKTVMGIVGSVIGTTFRTAASVISSTAGSIKQIIDGIAKVFSGLIDFISGVFTGNWRQAWEGVKNIFGGVFEGLAGLCKVPINAVIGVVNSAIKGINGISVDIPEGIPVVGGKHIGFSIPTIPALAKGAKDWRGGIAQIGEKGGEIVDLPRGSRIYPHDQSIRMARKSADGKLARAEKRAAGLEKSAVGKKGAGTIVIKIPKLAEQIIIRDEQDIDKLADKLAKKLTDTAKNMGVA